MGDKAVTGSTTRYDGACHCGRVRVVFETSVAPGDLAVRTCQCGFCRRHGARAISDPQGRMWIESEPGQEPKRYQFGLRNAEFLVCTGCGCYVAATMADGDDVYGIVNIRMLEDEALFAEADTPRVYDAEDETSRRERRRGAWTPVKRL